VLPAAHCAAVGQQMPDPGKGKHRGSGYAPFCMTETASIFYIFERFDKKQIIL
jgi:hypothetical protein